jgi:hypothetical protein
MRQTHDQQAATQALRGQAGPYRVTIDIESWPVIAGRYGPIEHHDEAALAVCSQAITMSTEREATIDKGVSIWGECGESDVVEPVWRAWLTLARLHRWEPAGTAPAVIDFETGHELEDS